MGMQTFQRGDVVKNNCAKNSEDIYAIIRGSYKDLYWDDDLEQYSLYLTAGDYISSWHSPEDLVFIRKCTPIEMSKMEKEEGN